MQNTFYFIPGWNVKKFIAFCKRMNKIFTLLDFVFKALV